MGLEPPFSLKYIRQTGVKVNPRFAGNRGIIKVESDFDLEMSKRFVKIVEDIVKGMRPPLMKDYIEKVKGL